MQAWNDFAAEKPAASRECIEQYADRIHADFEGFWWR